MIAANHLRVRDDVRITVVNPRASFVERIRLHQLLTGSDDAVVDYGTVLGDGIRLIVDEASAIDPAQRCVTLADGGTVGYDYLVYAVGSRSAAPTVPGAAEFAHPVAELEHAERLRAALSDAGPAAPLTVVGAWSDRHRDRRRARRAGPSGHPGVRRRARALPERARPPFGRPSTGRAGRDGAGHHGRRRDARTPSCSPTVASCAAPSRSGPRASGRRTWPRAAGCAPTRSGRLLTDETLTSIDDPRIVAAGDAAAPSGEPLRMSCQAAIPLGVQAANTVLSRIAGTEPAVISMAFVGQCISLGRAGGVIQPAHTDDTALPVAVGGRTAAAIKEAVCASTVSALVRAARKPSSVFWFKGGHRQRRLASAPVA